MLLKAGSIPKTSSGKIQRHACQAGYLAGTLARSPRGRPRRARSRSPPSPRRRQHRVELDYDGMEAPPTSRRAERRSDRRSVAQRRTPRRPSRRHAAAAAADDAAATRRQTAEIVEVVYAKVREIGRERVGELDWTPTSSSWGSIRSSGWRSSPRWKKRFGGRFPEDVLPDDGNLRRSRRGGRDSIWAASSSDRTARPPTYEIPPKKITSFDKSPEYLQAAGERSS